MKRYLTKDRISALLFLCFSVWVWFEAGTFPQSIFDSVGSAAYPRFLALLIGICSALLLFTSKDSSAEQEESSNEESKEQKNYLGVLFVSLDLILYLVLFRKVGFFISSFLFLLIFAFLFDKRPWKKRIVGGVIFAAIFTGVLYLLFGIALKVMLPTLLI